MGPDTRIDFIHGFTISLTKRQHPPNGKPRRNHGSTPIITAPNLPTFDCFANLNQHKANTEIPLTICY